MPMQRAVTGTQAGVFGSYSSLSLTQFAQPAVPATTVPQANIYPDQQAQVVIAANGATITNVSVNGVTKGAGAGTYTVPIGGNISIAYTVATPTWVWSVPVVFLAAVNANGTPVAATGVSV